jgi:hypothetical protein
MSIYIRWFNRVWHARLWGSHSGVIEDFILLEKGHRVGYMVTSVSKDRVAVLGLCNPRRWRHHNPRKPRESLTDNTLPHHGRLESWSFDVHWIRKIVWGYVTLTKFSKLQEMLVDVKVIGCYLHCRWNIWSVVAFCACGKLSSLSIMLLKTGQPEKTLAPGATSTTGKVGAYEELR